jgi:hypothetical protein
MRFLLKKVTGIILLACFTISVNAQTDSLENYVNRLKHSSATGGKETAFLSIGSDFMYAQEYFESGNFSSAEYSFMTIVRKEKDHPYANYQLAISLLKQNDPNKTKLAQDYLAKAFSKVPALKDRYKKDFPAANDDIAGSAGSDSPINNNVEATPVEATKADGLDAYIERIKFSRSNSGAATSMLSAGLDAFYGIEYFENGEFGSAETSFSLSLAKDGANPYVNYLKAVSLAAQGKIAESKAFLAKAVAADATLNDRFKNDTARATEKWNKKQEAKTVKSSPSKPVKYGGSLLFGNYTCHVSVWNGPNVSPAYRYDYKGYFALKKDGSYRWLDDGATGKFSYNSATGELTWLSGYFKGFQPKITQYQTGTKTAQITISFSDSYRWECGCNK